MLDGLLGRSGFYSKCKSLIKQTRTRIDVVRRKRNATQKFLREDIADLLKNGLDTTAFGRAEGLISELILSSCYEFIDHVCEIILKHLPVLQKLRECPEDCREAVASLMFAAARFSDLPELRDLRDLFQERYGSSLEYYVNQKLVQNITPKPSSTEKKVQLLQEIALEFSLRWDSRGFEERMSNSSLTEQKQWQRPGTVHPPETKVPTPFAEEMVQKTIKDEVLANKRSEATYQNKDRQVDGRYQAETSRDSVRGSIDDSKHNGSRRPELSTDNCRPPSYRDKTIQKSEDHSNYFQRREQNAKVHDSEENGAKAVPVGSSSRGKRLESVESQRKPDTKRPDNISGRDSPNTLSQKKHDPQLFNNGIDFPSPVDSELAEDIHVRSTRKRQEDVTNGSKSNFRGGIPPPYVRPRKSKYKAEEENDTLTFNPVSNSDRSEKLLTKADFPGGPEHVDDVPHYTAIYYKDDSSVEFTPKRRSHRRKHSRSSSTQDDKVNGGAGREEERVVRRVSTSRRKHESRKGLQILFDDDHYKEDEQERMIDKLLLHYSKKPFSGDPGKSRRETRSKKNDKSKSPCHKAVDETDMNESSTPTTSRSISLPSRQVTQPEPQQKAFTRAYSFQQERETPAKHVHPKLPDYDDLAATFAALRASKG